jgi:hypothetical protein
LKEGLTATPLHLSVRHGHLTQTKADDFIMALTENQAQCVLLVRSIEQITKRNSSFDTELSKRPPITLLVWILISTTFITGIIRDHFMADRWVNVIEWPIILLMYE